MYIEASSTWYSLASVSALLSVQARKLCVCVCMCVWVHMVYSHRRTWKRMLQGSLWIKSNKLLENHCSELIAFLRAGLQSYSFTALEVHDDTFCDIWSDGAFGEARISSESWVLSSDAVAGCPVKMVWSPFAPGNRNLHSLFLDYHQSKVIPFMEDKMHRTVQETILFRLLQ